jgi:16S rRNA G527 N7-methylase RsmG
MLVALVEALKVGGGRVSSAVRYGVRVDTNTCRACADVNVHVKVCQHYSSGQHACSRAEHYTRP